MLYELLRLKPGAGVIDVLLASKRCIAEIRESDSDHRDAMCAYIKRVCAFLIHPSGRECYAYILKSRRTYISPLKAKLMLKVIDSFNSGSGRKIITQSMCLSLHSASCRTFKKLSSCTDIGKSFSCRWCTNPITDKSSLYTLICKCSFRSGHEFCGKEFRRVHKRCPICRQQLLQRSGVSKYMFFNTDKMYDII